MAHWSRSGLLMVFTLALGLFAAACGGGKEVTSTRAAATATRPAATAAAPQATATRAPSQATATTAPVATPRPQPTATPSAAGAVAVGKLTVAVGGFSEEAVRPSLARGGNVGIYLGAMYDWLTWVNADGTLRPGAAESWQMAPDGMSWVFTIRDRMQFQNGAPLTAEDAKFSFDRVIADFPDPNHSTNASIWVDSVESVDALSPLTLRVKAKRPWPSLIYNLNPRSGPEGAVVPKLYFDRVGPRGFDEQPIGSGPWKFIKKTVGASFLFEASALSHQYRQTPRFKQLEFLAVAEESTRVAMVRTGQADLISMGSFDLAIRLGQNQDAQIFPIYGVNIGVMLIYGADDPRVKSLPTGRREVREALALLIDAKELASTVFGGLARVPARPVIGSGVIGYDPSWKPTEFNPTRAKELLTQAGYGQGFAFRVYSYNAPVAPWLPQMTEAVAGYWSSAGLKPELRPVDNAVVSQMYRTIPQGSDLIGQVSPIFATQSIDNLSRLRTFYHTRAILRLLMRPEMDALIDRAFAELDPQKQISLIREVEDIAHREFVGLPIVEPPDLIAAGKRIKEWQPIAGIGPGPALETVIPR